jgi:hypothetical protein
LGPREEHLKPSGKATWIGSHASGKDPSERGEGEWNDPLQEIRKAKGIPENKPALRDFHRNPGGYKQGENGELKRGRNHITGAQFLPERHARRNLVHGTFPEISRK